MAPNGAVSGKVVEPYDKERGDFIRDGNAGRIGDIEVIVLAVESQHGLAVQRVLHEGRRHRFIRLHGVITVARLIHPVGDTPAGSDRSSDVGFQPELQPVGRR